MRSASEQGFNSSDEAVGALSGTVIGPCAHGHVTIDSGSATEPVVGRTISQVNLLDITAGGKVGHAFNHLHHTGAALSHTAAVIEIVQTFVRVDSRVKGSLAQIRTVDAANLLAFLLESDRRHSRSNHLIQTNLQSFYER